MKKLPILLCFIALLGVAQAQVLTVSTNAKIVAPTQTDFLIGGKLVMTFSEPMTVYTPTTISVTLTRPATFFYCGDQTKPIAYRDGYARNELTVSCAAEQLLIKVDNRAYQGPVSSITVEGFILDVLYDSGLAVGDNIDALLYSTDDRITFSNPQVRLMRVGTSAPAWRQP